MLKTDAERIDYAIHDAKAILENIRDVCDNPYDIDPILKEIRILKEKIKMRMDNETYRALPTTD